MFKGTIIAVCMLLLSEMVVAKDAYLVFSSETGISHVACLLDYGEGNRKWIGFRPKKPKQIAGPGMIDESNREDLIETYVRFKVDLDRLKNAEATIRKKYKDRKYTLGVCDCVNMAADLARECQLKVKDVGNFYPPKFIKSLVKMNHAEADDLRPFPWTLTSIKQNEKVKVVLKNIKCEKKETIFVRDKIYIRLYSSFGKLKSPPQRHSMGTDDDKDLNIHVHTVPRGHSVAIQLWDEDSDGPDDLVFDWSVPTNEDGRFKKIQKRGTSAKGSESIYQVIVSVTPVN